MVLGQLAGLPAGGGLVLGAATATGLRVLALVTGWRLPPWSSGDVAK